MDDRSRPGFHDGELAVQRRAGVRNAADRLTGMLAPPDLGSGIGRFLAGRTFAAMTGRDGGGRLWISPLTGPPGFLDVTGRATLHVHSVPVPGDPLHGLPAGQAVGLLAVEFSRRRRARVNGTLTDVGDGLTVEVDQAYGNCPQYIHPRVLDPTTATGDDAGAVRRSGALSPADAELIRRADTVLLGTTHPDRGNDASHRGGPPGFVRVENEHTLWWPDYPGNNMFNSLGNLAVDPAAALLVVDFATGATVHLSGTARTDWSGPSGGAPLAGEAGTGRGVRFTVEAVTTGPDLPLRATEVAVLPR